MINQIILDGYVNTEITIIDEDADTPNHSGIGEACSAMLNGEQYFIGAYEANNSKVRLLFENFKLWIRIS